MHYRIIFYAIMHRFIFMEFNDESPLDTGFGIFLYKIDYALLHSFRALGLLLYVRVLLKIISANAFDKLGLRG